MFSYSFFVLSLLLFFHVCCRSLASLLEADSSDDTIMSSVLMLMRLTRDHACATAFVRAAGSLEKLLALERRPSLPDLRLCIFNIVHNILQDPETLVNVSVL